MKMLFYIGLIGLAVFEILNVYFIMPLPGSQEMNSIGFAYFLYTWRWGFRIVLGAMVLAGLLPAFQGKRKWIPTLVLLPAMAVTYLFNFQMTADKMFLQPERVALKSQAENAMPGSRLVVGIEHNGDARAYPVSVLTYHHQVQDTVGGKAIIVTYCSVCHTGRVFEPVVNGHHEEFRLVGMDHYNAMFEDATTRSWWRQATGRAVVGPLKGTTLSEIPSRQMTVDMFYALYPNGRVMQPDTAFADQYDQLARFEQGKSISRLTRTDTLSWKAKSWVVGLQVEGLFKAYDWNDLKKVRVINDRIGRTPIVLGLASDSQSFVAFERPSDQLFTLEQDTLFAEGIAYDLLGRNTADVSIQLKPIQASQEFWHSWATFYPETERYVLP